MDIAVTQRLLVGVVNLQTHCHYHVQGSQSLEVAHLHELSRLWCSYGGNSIIGRPGLAPSSVRHRGPSQNLTLRLCSRLAKPLFLHLFLLCLCPHPLVFPSNHWLGRQRVPDHDCVQILALTSILGQVELLLLSRREATLSIQRASHDRRLQEAGQLGDIGLCGAPLDEHATCAATVVCWVCDEDMKD